MFTAEETQVWTMYVARRIEIANNCGTCTTCRLSHSCVNVWKGCLRKTVRTAVSWPCGTCCGLNHSAVNSVNIKFFVII